MISDAFFEYGEFNGKLSKVVLVQCVVVGVDMGMVLEGVLKGFG